MLESSISPALAHTRPISRLGGLLCALALALLGPGLPAAGAEEPATAEAAVVRLLLPAGGRAEGKTLVETLVVDPGVHRVVFLVDGEEVASQSTPPYSAKVRLASPPREQTLEVRALGEGGRLMGRDSAVVNRERRPLRVRITALEGDPTAGAVTARFEVSVPRKAELEAVDVYLGSEKVASLGGPPFEARLETPSPRPEDFVRVEARLRDGRSVEDVALLLDPELEEEIDVNLVQLQVLVTRENGMPVEGLERSDFRVHQRGEPREVDRVFPAADVALVLGLAVDASGSMEAGWGDVRRAVEALLRETLGARDRAFLVDFDSELRLRRGLTGELGELSQSLGEVRPGGGTALYDSILFSLLQFEDEPGRRALVVLTDGLEADSRTDPRRAVEAARRLGVPVYVVALAPPSQRAGALGVDRALELGYSVQELQLLTLPTGGRLFRPASLDGVLRAFAQIAAELRHQYVVTYYTDELPEEGDDRKIEVEVEGRGKLEVRAVLPLDQAG